MLTVAEARARILARIQVLESEEVSLLKARERVLAEEVRAVRDVPPFANSAMDGYALRAGDISGATAEHPVRLRMLGEIRAGGSAPIAVQQASALRIMTGAMLPPGADAVVRVEDTGESDGQVLIRVPVGPGVNVREAGTDLAKDTVVAGPGRLLSPGLIGVLASAGRPAVRCVRRPRVHLLTTGDELREAGDALAPGEITNTNRYTLLAAVEAAGGIGVDAGVARDDRDELALSLDLARQADLVVTTGGVSMGAYDLVRSLLEERGAVDFWQVALRPGKPLIFGSVGNVPLIGLPGNPVSALVGFELFVKPVLRKMQGRQDSGPPLAPAITEDQLSSAPHLEQYLRGVARRDSGRLLVRLTGNQGSHVLSSMAEANCLIRIPAGEKEIKAGQAVDVIPLTDLD